MKRNGGVEGIIERRKATVRSLSLWERAGVRGVTVLGSYGVSSALRIKLE
jgi:hypothetical protein